ncbi:nucleotide-diphospho-sugar transferase [Lipomyces orientalis]|uniref:Nucleotide-diphospho-sugar transferase n=1 Tax=Lipomyces orientalis TaxID=1233043 RepID=A0ACC3TNW4_9ASCO
MIMPFPSFSPFLRRAIYLINIGAFIGTLYVSQGMLSRSLPNSLDCKTVDDQDHRRASQFLRQDPLSRPLPTNFGAIPKLIHQSWSTPDLPSKFATWSRSCREQNPDWEWVLWTDEDNLNLVKSYCPWLLTYYQQLRGEIYRADIVRNLYMYIYGGIYADLDVECLRPANELFESHNVSTIQYNSSYETSNTSNHSTGQGKAFFGRMGADDQFEQSIPNAWMASTPGHPFFLLPLESAVHKLSSKSENASPESFTGPIALKEAITTYFDKYSDSDELEERLQDSSALKGIFGSEYKMKHSIEVLPFWNVFPYSWSRDGDEFRSICSANSAAYDKEKCKLIIATDHWGSYFITYWSHTWSWEGHDENHMKNVEKRLLHSYVRK